MFAHVLALCFILRLLKRSNHYVPYELNFAFIVMSSSVFLHTQLKVFKFRKSERINQNYYFSTVCMLIVVSLSRGSLMAESTFSNVKYV